MKHILILTFILFNFGLSSNFMNDLEKAKTLYEKGREDEARVYYMNASKKGSAEAHFKLAYNYIVDREESIYHYSEAAKLGHPKALDYSLEYLFFRGNDLVTTDPKKALEIYNIAKSRNPQIKLYDEENSLKLLKLASKVPPLDGVKLIKEYKLDKDEGFNDDSYYIWKLAEMASKGEKFRNPSPLLVLQLIIKGGQVPTELESAVTQYYDIWKSGQGLVEFDMFEHIDYNNIFGRELYAETVIEKNNEKIKMKLDKILTENRSIHKDLLFNTFNTTSEFLEAKVWNEEDHDGSGYVLWAKNSLIDQKNKYLRLVQEISSGFIPECEGSFDENDVKLNKMYKEIRDTLRRSPIHGMRMAITEDGFRDVQRSWIPYRDKNVKLLCKLSKQKNTNFWKNYFTIERLRQYDSLIERIELYNN